MLRVLLLPIIDVHRKVDGSHLDARMAQVLLEGPEIYARLQREYRVCVAQHMRVPLVLVKSGDLSIVPDEALNLSPRQLASFVRYEERILPDLPRPDVISQHGLRPTVDERDLPTLLVPLRFLNGDLA